MKRSATPITLWGGPALAIGAGVAWSLGSVAARMADEADAWQYLLWRSVAIIVVVEVLHRRRAARSALVQAFTSGGRMLVGCATLLLASVSFVYAIKNTVAANAAFLASVSPLVAVLFGRVVLGERLTRTTIAAMAVAFGGLAVMVIGDVSAGTMTGNMSALLSAVGTAGYAVCIRSRPNADWTPVLPGYGVMMIVLCGLVTMVRHRPLVPPVEDVGYALFHGGVLIVVGTIWFNRASRTVAAVPMTIFAQSEMVFVPVWVFLKFGEQPKATTILGGVIVLAAVVGKAVLENRLGVPEPVSV